MTESGAPLHLSPIWPDDPRRAPSRVGPEPHLLEEFLDWHRATIELKCHGVPEERLSCRAVPPSSLSLHGLLRHLAGVERWWFRIQFAGEEVPLLHYSDADPDQDFADVEGDVAEALAEWKSECQRSREIVAAAASLDQMAARDLGRGPFTLRWLLLDMIGEYARHCGHADLLRERIDGATGL